MKKRAMKAWRAGLACLGLFHGAAQAAISCGVSSGGFSVVYDPSATTANDSVAAATITCTRLPEDPASVAFALNANNGLYPQGQANRARLGATNNYITYNLYRNATYANRWGPQQSAAITGTVSFGAALFASYPVDYYVRINAQQNVAQGSYLDTVSMTLTYGAVTAPPSTFQATITTGSQCQISTPPGSVAFAYTSFQQSASSASTSYAVRCTSGLPYTMSLDATRGTLLGLTYNLSLGTSASTGTGVAQDHVINGTLPANQVGTCATATCSATQTRTLTITY